MRLDKYSEYIRELRFKEEPESTATQAARAKVLKAILAANGGKMLAKDCRRQMRLLENTFSELLKTLRDGIVSRQFHFDRRRIVLELI